MSVTPLFRKYDTPADVLAQINGDESVEKIIVVTFHPRPDGQEDLHIVGTENVLTSDLALASKMCDSEIFERWWRS